METRRFLALLLIVTAMAFAAPAGAGSSDGARKAVGYTRTVVLGFPVHAVTVDLSSAEVAVRPVVTPTGSGREFTQLLTGAQGRQPLAAITGTFFDTRSKVIVGNVVSEGRLLAEGAVGSAITIDAAGRAGMKSSANQLGRYFDWTPYQFAVAGGPTLLRDGGLAVNPRGEGFGDPAIFGPRSRAVLGVTDSNKLLMVTIAKPISVHDLARVMRELGAVHAVNMDGGKSAALFYKGAVLTSPKSRLTNLVAVYPRGGVPADERLGRVLSQRAQDHFQRGSQYLRAGDLRLARSHLRMATSTSPDQPRYWSVLATAEAGRGDSGSAADACVRAARLYLAAGKADLALEVATRARQLEPDGADARLVHEMATHRLARIEEGLEAVPDTELSVAPGEEVQGP